MINFLIIHYNTPLLTECLVKSINKYVGANCCIYIFDNSDRNPFTYKQDNIILFDNTKSQIIDFNKELSKYPQHNNSLGKYSRWGSFKHCISVEKCFDLVNDNFILLDSDVLLLKDSSELFDENYYAVGEVADWSWDLKNKNYPKHKRIKPFIAFINVKLCKEEGIHFYNDEHMDGLYDSITKKDKKQLEKDSYDTGCWFYKGIKKKPIKLINCDDYVVHFGGGSYLNSGKYEKLSQNAWLKKYSKHYDDGVVNKVDKKKIEHKRPIIKKTKVFLGSGLNW